MELNFHVRNMHPSSARNELEWLLWLSLNPLFRTKLLISSNTWSDGCSHLCPFLSIILNGREQPHLKYAPSKGTAHIQGAQCNQVAAVAQS